MENVRPIIELLELALTVIIVAMIAREISDNRTLTTQIESLNETSTQTNANIQILIGKQTDALRTLEATNRELQDSVRNTHDAVSAARSQLKIIKQQQDRLAAERARKPKLVLYVNAMPVRPDTPNQNFPAKTEETQTTLYIWLQNDGDLKATNGTFKTFVSSKDVTIQNSMPSQMLQEAPFVPGELQLTGFQQLLPHIHIPMTITLTYPKGQQRFSVAFAVDADELLGTQVLGQFEVTPPAADSKP